jgi:hypothetical protein
MSPPCTGRKSSSCGRSLSLATRRAPGLSIDRKLADDDVLFFVARVEGCVVGTIMAVTTATAAGCT